MKVKKLTALALAGIMTLSAAACGGQGAAQGTTEANTTTSAPETTAVPETTTEAKSPGEVLAEKYTGFVETPSDLGGRTIKVVTTVASRYTYATDEEGKPSPDKTSNETLEIMAAIESVEKDYNCKIEFEQMKGKDMVEALITSQAAGETYCDILEFGCSDTYLEQIYSANLCMDLNDPAIADIIALDSNPWLQASDFGQFAGAHYGVHFKTNNSGDLLRGVVLFNKNLAEQYGVGDLYEMYDNKTWTFDKLTEICASVASQSDGTVYPLMYSQEGLFIPMLIYANGGSVTDYADGKFVFSGLSDNTLEAINYAVDWQQKGYIHPDSEQRKINETTFANGGSLFFVGNYASLKKYTTGSIECNFEVGLLPGPLGPHSADNEYNAVSYTEAMFNVMANVEKPEEVAAVLVAIANRTAKHDMLETELMNTLQDEKSAEILDHMYNNMRCDYSRSISTSRSLFSGANKSIMALEKTPKEAYEEIAAEAQVIYDGLNQ